MDTGSPASDSSEKSELVVYEPSVISPISDPLPNAPASIYSDSDPRPQELTAHVPGDNATHHTHGAPAQQPLRFDPRALLNPSSSNPKRPASSGNDTDRGRADPTIAGQVSLVERLHNVQESAHHRLLSVSKLRIREFRRTVTDLTLPVEAHLSCKTRLRNQLLHYSRRDQRLISP